MGNSTSRDQTQARNDGDTGAVVEAYEDFRFPTRVSSPVTHHVELSWHEARVCVVLKRIVVGKSGINVDYMRR